MPDITRMAAEAIASTVFGAFLNFFATNNRISAAAAKAAMLRKPSPREYQRPFCYLRTEVTTPIFVPKNI
jgi:hypothetical protein